MANNTEDVELVTWLEIYKIPNAKEVIASYLQQEANRQKAEMLDRLEVHTIETISGTIAIPYSAIEAERKQLEKGLNDE